jgi:gamma-glutamyltranspeptidase/glutathione hydrolase
MTVGSPGGSTIITSVLQTILNVYEYNFSMQEAVNSDFTTMVTDLITFEPNTFNTQTDTLKAKAILSMKNNSVIGRWMLS